MSEQQLTDAEKRDGETVAMLRRLSKLEQRLFYRALRKTLELSWRRRANPEES